MKNNIKIIQGNALDELKKMPTESVDMIMTSPPYWALRDYGTAGQLGLENTFEEYINKLCDIFDEVRRVLKPEGTCWINLGDSYGNGNKGKGNQNKASYKNSLKIKTNGAHKCLLMIPSRFAIEMTNRGWILRNKIIWHKLNCMPASTKDRFTVDYEEIFFFTKNKKYYFEQQFEPLAESTKQDHRLFNKKFTERRRQRNYPGQAQQGSGMLRPNDKGRNMRSIWKINSAPFSTSSERVHFAVYPEKLCVIPISSGSPKGGVILDPFLGAGTTLKVARDLGRRGIGIEINPKYIKIAKTRLEK